MINVLKMAALDPIFSEVDGWWIQARENWYRKEAHSYVYIEFSNGGRFGIIVRRPQERVCIRDVVARLESNLGWFGVPGGRTSLRFHMKGEDGVYRRIRSNYSVEPLPVYHSRIRLKCNMKQHQ